MSDAVDDGINVIYFKDEQCPYGDTCIGQITFHLNGVWMHGFDVVLYSTMATTGWPVYWSVKEFPDPLDSDLWFVTMHELGHSLGLNHSFSGSVMGTTCGMGCTIRELQWDDIDGILAIYGGYTTEGFWASTETAAPGETFTLQLDYALAPDQQYQVFLDLTGDDGFPLRNWSSTDSRILPINGNFFPVEDFPEVFVDFGTEYHHQPGGPNSCDADPLCRRLDANGQATVTVNLPENAIELFGTDLYVAAVTWDTQYVNDIEDVSVGVHVQIQSGCMWDLDDSGSVGAADLLSLLVSWGPCKGCPADFDGNGSVGASDLLALLVNWGPCP